MIDLTTSVPVPARRSKRAMSSRTTGGEGLAARAHIDGPSAGDAIVLGVASQLRPVAKIGLRCVVARTRPQAASGYRAPLIPGALRLPGLLERTSDFVGRISRRRHAP
jgi:hypothetical protein